ncbi:A/G-specific adenine glycosylase [Methylobacter sp. S3L5C]|uniref:A/G-specific adenine glycosylase n=1 Tax=Methylobacter sp. S3L5C TaxID=2839024 RepID=UPI001FAE352C|nr:A/G-specific adenine glycosylase [Methylobacter sp. S3L5C]UOA09902.1 A/G-specific adenine glycosylase [Methylobacter sp. S3L5C]
MNPSDFQQHILAWFDQKGRKDLPWQKDISPYRVWLSETMLQQTQVSTVIPYFNAFIEQFPTLESLAQAPADEILHRWSGLGYYARARNLHKTAQLIAEQGYFPDTLAELNALPGIGLSTAGAILSIAFQKSHPILDGNVKRVLARFKAVSGWPGTSLVNKELWAISTHLTPIDRVADYTQAMMDLGATVCTRSKPKCADCPLEKHCLARSTETVSLLPTRKPSKILPVKQLVFLLLSNNNKQTLLEKRPPTGIWGGLWSLPEFDSIESAHNWCLTNNRPVIDSETLATRRHTFSHYHLDYTPVLIQTDNLINFVMEANQTVWYNAKQINLLGLPAPIKLLLQQHTRE